MFRNSPLYPRRPMERGNRAFTLVELLTVVLILAILMAVALPLYLNAITESAKRTTRSNMNMLINVEQAYRTEKHVYTENMSDLLADKDLDQEPKGPGNLVYDVYIEGSTKTLPDGRAIPTGGVAACATDGAGGPATYGCYIPGVDAE